VDSRAGAALATNPGCAYLLRVTRARTVPATLAGWIFVAEARRPTDRDEVTLVYRRARQAP
jgi:hypothetical protein